MQEDLYMAKVKKGSDNLVFGLDIGTRSIVGTVGYIV
jgi:cell division ATPase FtsA